jgi:predicted lipoprotein with Yx(FWY)xxD motif
MIAIAGALCVLVFGACGDDSGSSSTGATSPATGASSTTAAPTTSVASSVATTATPATTSAAAVTTAAAAATVKVSDSKLGQILTDDAGRTLYVFANDVKGKSNCVGTCAATWPVYAPATIAAGAGVDASKLATIDTAGKKQLTIDGVPLYYYGGDAKPGDTNGQNVGGIWFVVDATGKAIK